MIFVWYEFSLPCQLTHRRTGEERVQWLRLKSESDRLKDWIAAARVQCPGHRFDEVLCWNP
jgi:hypothetical protein